MVARNGGILNALDKNWCEAIIDRKHKSKLADTASIDLRHSF